MVLAYQTAYFIKNYAGTAPIRNLIITIVCLIHLLSIDGLAAFQQHESVDASQQIDLLGNEIFVSIYEDVDKALFLADSMLQMSHEIGDRKGVITAYYNFGSIYLTIANYDSAITNYKKSVHIAEVEKQIEMLPKVYTALGIALDESGKTNAAH